MSKIWLREEEVDKDPEHRWEHNYSLKQGDIYVEAGAYLCRYGRIASEKVGERGRVILIEPEPTNVGWIKKVVKEKGLTNITLIEKAVWSKRGTVNFIVNETTPSGSRIGKSPEYEGVRMIEVEADTVDNILDGLGLDHVDLFVADVENAEIEMVKGMDRWLGEKKIGNIGIAAYHKHPDGNYEAIGKALRSHGYVGVNVWGGVVYAHV